MQCYLDNIPLRSIVPEPATGLLLALGGLAAMSRRTRK
ncbi:MAG: PEP-CTERM sorting domain-containing protein [Planctomycetota bacterium]